VSAPPKALIPGPLAGVAELKGIGVTLTWRETQEGASFRFVFDGETEIQNRTTMWHFSVLVLYIRENEASRFGRPHMATTAIR